MSINHAVPPYHNHTSSFFNPIPYCFFRLCVVTKNCQRIAYLLKFSSVHAGRVKVGVKVAKSEANNDCGFLTFSHLISLIAWQLSHNFDSKNSIFQFFNCNSVKCVIRVDANFEDYFWENNHHSSSRPCCSFLSLIYYTK